MTKATASTRAGLTKDQNNTFFTSSKQMEVEENFKRLGGRMKNLDKVQGDDNPSTIPQTPYPFG
eukprot:8768640-Ditylum_brightwellii.AAC.1